ncbi:MAG: PASTA domain-containing protein [Planctomycetia bacterium]|nr:PASTA domain-containing protein [Planctomycetia bacterium]
MRLVALRFVVLLVALIVVGSFTSALCAQEPPAAASGEAVIPAILGRTAKEARAALTAAGFVTKFQLGKPAASATTALTVYAVEPAVGRSLPRGSVVLMTLYAEATPLDRSSQLANDGRVLRSDATKVPLLIGKSAAEAKAALKAAGLTTKFLLGNAAPSPAQKWIVYEQHPRPDAALKFGEPVAIVVYASSASVTNPELTQVRASPLVDDGEAIVDERSGRLLVAATDLRIAAGRISLAWIRTWDGVDFAGSLGGGWRHNWQRRLDRSTKQATILSFTGSVTFEADAEAGGYRAASGDRLTSDGERFVWTMPDGTIERFDAQGRLVERDENGRGKLDGGLVALEYDAAGRLVRLNGPCRTTLQLRYDARGRVVAVESSTGSIVRYGYGPEAAQPIDEQAAESLSVGYAYDAAGALTRIDHPQFGTTEFAYDPQGRVRSRTFADGTTETYARDDATKTLRRTDGAGHDTTTVWSVDGRRAEVTDPLGNKSTLEYDAAGRVTALAGATGVSLRNSYDAQGRLRSVTEPATGTTRFEYLGESSLVAAIVPADGRRQTMEYDDRRRPTRIVDSFDPANSATFTYDADGQVASLVYGNGRKQFFMYDASGRRESERDGEGSVRRFAYDARGNPTRETDPAGGVTLSTYDAQDRLLSVTDPMGAAVRYRYEQGKGRRVVHETDPRGGTTRTTFDLRGRVSAVEDPSGGVVRYAYDPAGRLSQETDALGRVFRYEYDAAGRRTVEIDPLGRKTATAYDTQGRPIRITVPDGSSTSYEYSSAGRLVKSIDASGIATTYDYDATGRMSSRTEGKRKTNIEYTLSGKPQRIVTPPSPVDTREYDEAGNLMSVRRGNRIVATYRYDGSGRCVEEKHPTGLRMSYGYDAVGRLATKKNNLGVGEEFTYDAAGRLTKSSDAGASGTTYGYDSAGNLLSVTNPLGKSTQRTYDALDRQISVATPVGDQARYEYDAAGRLTTAYHPAGGKTQFAYDPLDNVVNSVRPDGGKTVSSFDAAGRRASTTDAKGQVTKYHYDQAGRIVRKELSDGKVVHSRYDAVGRLTELDDGSFPIRYEYDQADRVVRIEYPTIKRSLGYEYDPAGRLIRFTDPAGRVVTYEYDEADRMTSIQPADGGAIRLSYDEKNRRTAAHYPNGVEVRWEYDALDRPLRLTYVDAKKKMIAGWTYAYDAAGNRTMSSEVDGPTARYRYDDANQLIEESVGDGPAVRYAYSAGGNRSSLTTSDAKVEYRYDPADRLLSAGKETFLHDANGNLIERRGPDGTIRYAYDTEDRLVRVELVDGKKIEYGYAPTGERIWRRDARGIKHFVGDGTHLLAELDGELKVTASFVHGPDVDQPLAMSRDGNWSYFHADRLGSVRRLTDAAGTVTVAQDYDPFGTPRNTTGQAIAPFSFAGREYDTATGLYYNRARYYDPRLGRFLSEDPAAPSLVEPRTLNPYLYALNNPLELVDPWGAEGLRVNMLKGMGPSPTQLPVGLDPTAKIHHFTNPEFSGAVVGAAAKGQGIVPRGGDMHVTTLAPGSGNRFPTGIGTPKVATNSFNAPAGDLAKAGNVIELNPHPPLGAPPGSALILKPPPGEKEIRLPRSTRGGGGYGGPNGGARGRGGFIAVSVGGPADALRGIGKGGLIVTALNGGMDVADLYNGRTTPGAIAERYKDGLVESGKWAVGGGVLGGIAGGLIGGVLTGGPGVFPGMVAGSQWGAAGGTAVVTIKGIPATGERLGKFLGDSPDSAPVEPGPRFAENDGWGDIPQLPNFGLLPSLPELLFDPDADLARRAREAASESEIVDQARGIDEKFRQAEAARNADNFGRSSGGYGGYGGGGSDVDWRAVGEAIGNIFGGSGGGGMGRHH